ETGVASATGPPLGETSASKAPTETVSPSAAWILTIVPAAGEGTSASTLSVEISTSVSSAATVSPSCLCHSSTVPSVTESPIAGMTTSTMLVPPVIYLQLSRLIRGPDTSGTRPAALLDHEPQRPGERAQAAQYHHVDGEPQGNDPGTCGGQADERHPDPHQPVCEAEDEGL